MLASAIEREWQVAPETQTSRWVIHVADGQSPGQFAELGATLTPINGWSNTYLAEWNNSQSVAERGTDLTTDGTADWFYPLVSRQQDLRFIPNDPLFASQWHLLNTGQGGGTIGADVDATTVWDITTSGGAPVRGDGVVVAIVDNGLQRTHPDLIANYNAALSYDFNGDDTDPLPISTHYHGTAIAGLIGASGDNSIGVTGLAPNASLAGLRLIAGPTDDVLEAAALGYHQQDIDIYNSSWGPKDGVDWLASPGPLTKEVIESGIQSGRGGLGNIYVWAAGNGRTSNDNINYDGYANSRYVIAVGAIDHNDEQAWYSEPGAPMLVTAYSGGNTTQLTTTDLMGSSGKNGLSDLDYTNLFSGTSASSPVVAGTIALMLQANPNLSYRDVQHILIAAARKNDPTDPDWTMNGAGHAVNHKYGFGAVDADGAVLLAKHWTPVDAESPASFEPPAGNGAIPDNDAVGLSSVVDVTSNVRVEHVEVVVDIAHPTRGQLEVILTSPSGTQSVLAEQHGDTGADYSNWVFTSIRHWDESSLGTWTLTVRDRVTGATGRLNDWRLRIFGTPPQGPLIKDLETNELVYLENSTAQLTASLTIDLPSNGLVSEAAVVVAGGFQAGEDELLFSELNGISGTFTENRLTLSGLRFKSDYEAALRSVLYRNNSNDPTATVRRIAFQVTDPIRATGGPVFRDIVVVPINDPPTFESGPDIDRDEDAGLQIISGWATNISAGTGESSQTVSFEIVANSNPGLFAVGPVVTANGTLEFKSSANAFGNATIDLWVRDNGGTENGGIDASAVVSFIITIDSVNDRPNAAFDRFTGTEDIPLVIPFASLIANDDDIEGDTLVPTNVSQPLHGTVSTSGDGTLLYTPHQDFFGVDTFTYTANDGAADSDPVTVVISVLPINDAPKAQDDWVDVPSTREKRIPVLDNDSDADNDLFRILSYSRPQKGRLTRVGSALVYAPAAGAAGTDTFTYLIADPKGATASSTVHLNLIDTTPPRIEAIRVWNGRRYLNLAGASRMVLPWAQTNRIQLVFSERVVIADGSLSLDGSRTGTIPMTPVVELTGRVMTVTFSPLGMDRYTLRLGAGDVIDMAGNHLYGNLARSFAILPGDFDGNGLVNNLDLIGIRRNYSSIRPYNIFADVDGNGIVNVLDYNAARQFLGRRL